MRRFGTIIALVVTLTLVGSPAKAAIIDLSGVSVTGTNPFNFNDADLGVVTLEYSGNPHPNSFPTLGPIITNFASINTIALGQNSGTGRGILKISWENPVASLDFRIYDLDLAENVIITPQGGETIVLVSDNPLIADNLVGNTLSAGNADLPNANVNNFASLRIDGTSFNMVEFSFERPGVGSGLSGIGFGQNTAASTIPESPPPPPPC